MEIYKHTVTFYSTSKDAGSEVSECLTGSSFTSDSEDSSGKPDAVFGSAFVTKKVKLVEDK